MQNTFTLALGPKSGASDPDLHHAIGIEANLKRSAVVAIGAGQYEDGRDSSPAGYSRRPRDKEDYCTSSLSWASTTDQGSTQCLSVMVTITLCPILRYSPLTISCEKRPDPSPPSWPSPAAMRGQP